jgi:2-polyprenyl-3-methyl-5-hydroxy-6-metoxy-1,4-benzoquinol methylase
VVAMAETPDGVRSPVRVCWCGNDDLGPFSADYLRCPRCETLVSQYVHTQDVSRVTDDEADLYGRDYWFGHMEQELGFADIYQRARTDLTERCPHWLMTILKYKTPPGRALELGCAHGGFVAVLRASGFDATGLELSPGIVTIARALFGVPMLQGPIEDQPIELGSLDILAMMDVIEHLPDPVQTMTRCVELLRPDGVLVIQTPQYPEGASLAELERSGHRFVEMLKPQEHLYLFSASSVGQLLSRLQCPHLSFEHALFSHYDMFIIASRGALEPIETARQEERLAATPSGRLVQAMLDLSDQTKLATDDFLQADADRTARLEQIRELESQLAGASADAQERLKSITLLEAWLAESEADRRKRGNDLDQLHALFQDSEADRFIRGQQLERMEQLLKESEADRAARLAMINELGIRLAEADADRTARLDVIHRLEARLAALESTSVRPT